MTTEKFKENLKYWVNLLGYSPLFVSRKKENILNPGLLYKNKVSKSNFDQLCKLHQKKDRIFGRMEQIICHGKNCGKKDKLRDYAKQVTEIEFAMQELWGFGRDRNFHEFWRLPHCKCPKLDNEDMKGTSWHYYNDECPIHGQ